MRFLGGVRWRDRVMQFVRGVRSWQCVLGDHWWTSLLFVGVFVGRVR